MACHHVIINNVRSRKATRRVRSQVDRVSPFKRNEHLENNAGQEASKPLQFMLVVSQLVESLSEKVGSCGFESHPPNLVLDK